MSRNKIVRKAFLWVLAGLIVLACSLIIFRTEENWRARRDLARCESELKARGEKLDFASFIPPPVVEADNFGAAPLFVPIFKASRKEPGQESKPRDPALERWEKVDVNVPITLPARQAGGLGDYETGRPVRLREWQRSLQNGPQQNGDEREAGRAVLTWLTKWSPALDEFTEAANRPYARFPLAYEKGLAMQLPHVSTLLRLSKVYCLRAAAALEAGDLDLALRDVNTLNRMQAAIRSEPLLISQLVRVVMIKVLAQVVWQGCVEHRWRGTQLEQIEAMLAQIDLIADSAHAIRGERAAANSMYQDFLTQRRHLDSVISEYFDWMNLPVQHQPWLSLIPADAVLRRNQLWNERWVQDHVLPIMDAPAHRIYPERQEEAERINSETKSNLYNCIAKLSAGMYPSVTMRTAATQVALDQARVACVLERFRLQTGQYPHALDELVPRNAPTLCRDVINGEPFRYRLESDSSYLLYSVGWNKTDDGGAVELRKLNDRSPRDNERGDWVWYGSVKN